MKSQATIARSYIGTFLALMALLAVTIAAAYVDLGKWNLPIAMTISIAQAALIIVFFMHVRQRDTLIPVIAVAGFFWLMILLSLAMTDYATRHPVPQNTLRQKQLPLKAS